MRALLVAAVAVGRVLVFDSSSCGQCWMPANVPVEHWTSVAASADGYRLVVAGEFSPIWATTNSGATWTQMISPFVSWSSIAQSADGTKMVAAADNDLIYTLQPGPTLNITPAGSDLLLSWPAYLAHFALQQSSDLNLSHWTNVTVAPRVTNGQNQVMIPPVGDRSFYRLGSL